MKNRLVIIGAGGHGKVIADIAVKIGYTEIAFVDDNVEGECMGFPIMGKCTALMELNDGQTEFILAIGNNGIRQKIAEKYPLNWTKLIHPSAQIGFSVTIGEGTVVMAGAVINACTKIGRHCIINTCAIVEHDNVLEDYVHISPNAVLGGTVFVGEGAHISIGATVRNNINICRNCVVGAGSAVVKDIGKEGIYVGVPSNLLKRVNK